MFSIEQRPVLSLSLSLFAFELSVDSPRICRVFQVLAGRNSLGHAITGFLFAAHPIHSEAVAGVVGRADLLACLFTLLAFLAYSAHCERARSPFPLILALVSSTLATLAKETGISSLALCLLWELCRGESSRKVRTL